MLLQPEELEENDWQRKRLASKCVTFAKTVEGFQEQVEWQ